MHANFSSGVILSATIKNPTATATFKDLKNYIFQDVYDNFIKRRQISKR